jgi:hypothetical protein
MGGKFTAKENQVLMPLVADCVNFGLRENEALAYIKVRLGREISKDAYYERKKKVDSGEYAKEWLSYFTKIGFTIKHKQILDVVEMVQQDTIRDYLIEQNRPHETRDKLEIRQLRYDIRENAKLIQELSLGTPIVAQIKAKIDHVEMLQPSQ